MGKIQFQKGSLMTSIPPTVIDKMKLQKGDTVHFNITDSGRIELIKVKEESK